jgi:hypothetical protein
MTALAARSNLALLPLPPLDAAVILASAGRGGYTSGAPTTPRRITPHPAGGGAEPVLRRGRVDDRSCGDGLGCA